MVAAHKCCAQRAHALDHLVRVRAVADNIAKIPDFIVRGRKPKHSIKSLQVRVDVGEKKRAHDRLTGYYSPSCQNALYAANPVPRVELAQRAFSPCGLGRQHGERPVERSAHRRDRAEQRPRVRVLRRLK